MTDLDHEWRRKGATLSDKTARREFGLTQDEIVEAIRAGKLQYRVSSMHGNPWFRLLRGEVEELVTVGRGSRYLAERQAKAELARIDSDLKRLRSQLAVMETRRAEVAARLVREADSADGT
jgi:hypothetical protein